MTYQNSAFASAVLLRQKRALENLEEATATFVAADMAYVMICTVAVFIITPAIGLFYGGMIRRKSVIQLLTQTYLVTSVITIQWYLMGYSLACSTTSTNEFIGNFRMGALSNVDEGPLFEDGSIPSIIYFTFSCFFPIATVQIFLGAIAERGRLLPSLVLAFLWATIVYCPLAYWAWSGNGWLYKLGELDFAGGGPVHIASGVASLSYSFFLGRRKEWKDGSKEIPHLKPHSPVTTMVGVSLIWMAWLCFNSGTLISVNLRTGYIMANTQLAAAFACLTFTVTDFLITGKWSIMAACDGAIAGLVAITPCCGFVTTWGAAITAIVTALACRLTYGVNKWLRIDDVTYSFNLHGIGGMVGSIVGCGLLASPNITALDGASSIAGGWIWHHWEQMGYQIAGICAITAYTFCVTYILCFGIDKIPGLKMRASEEAEEMGMDLYEMAETVDEFVGTTSGYYNPGNVEYFSGSNSTNEPENKSTSKVESKDV
ncbi:putative ammonium transporter [Ascoidea rubescens DSM 1968]|uniref:Ammonium transporter n=1 Tax=Ascoidea rubescens DSM 1968 TaxID=1344418 RepID=A0A1D2VLY9_9ASCO|nr:putative ammonium transporter [Ascoidea rubescens DSM 1968]ODV62619.1 putative ammonium transporter [Ascoidea rubescens DSM 1968]